MNLRCRVILCVACCAAMLCRAADWTIRSWDTESGLPQNSIFAIAQTPDGYLWLGTGKGLARFDGRRFTRYAQLSDSRIHTLFVDSRGTLWIGTEAGAILMMRDGQFEPVPGVPVGPSERRLVSACEDSDGSVWLLNKNKELWRYDGQHSALFYLGDNESNEGKAIIKELNGPVIVATERKQSTILTGAAGLSDVRFTNEIAARTQALLASRQGGHWRLADLKVYYGTNREDEVEMGFGPSIWPSEPSAVCEDSEGNLVVGTPGAGLFWVKRDRSTASASFPGGPLHNWVLSLFTDREGTLWVGTDGDGLKRLTPKVFNVIVENRTVGSVSEDGQGRIWFGSTIYGVACWQTGVVTTVSTIPVSSVLVDGQQRVWAGTHGRGLFQYAGSGFAPTGALGQQTFHAAFEDHAGNVWFGTSAGLLRFSKGEWRLFTSEDGLSSDIITAIAEDRTGDLWVGTERGGVNQLHQDRFTTYRRSDGAPGDDVAALLIDTDGTLWVSTAANGLGRLVNGKWSRFTSEQGLPTLNLSYLVEDRDDLWMGSYGGIVRASKRELNEVAEGKRARARFRSYGKEDGLQTTECVGSQPGGQPGALRDSAGRLWFSTIKGLAWTDPAHLFVNTNPPPVRIEALLVDNKGVPLTNSLTLKPTNERLEIHYTALTLRAPERALFRYKLQGADTVWTEAGDSRVVRYGKLPAGKFIFQVTACNEDGVWNERGAELALIVEPPIWQTWWFITAMTLAAIGGIAGMVHLVSTQRYQRELAVLRQQEALEKERARIARDIHDQVGASLTQVALLGELVESDKDSPEAVHEHAEQISQTARETTRALDEIVWTVNPQNDTLEGLVNYICKYAQDYLGVAGIKYRLDVPAQLPSAAIAPDVRHNVFLASKEAVTNIVRHAKAESAWVRVRVVSSVLTVEVEDNGRGLGSMDAQRARTRHGLSNMQKRMEDIGGTFTLESGAQGGALVRLTVPVKVETMA